MATEPTPEVAALQREIAELRTGLDAAVQKMRRLNGDGDLPNGHDSALASAEKMWTELKQQAHQVSHEIEERPFISAITAFGVGITVGMLFRGGHRG
jgi:ElaB/YqjD/DUF883 family membrane-anchored ribosome-binding protein